MKFKPWLLASRPKTLWASVAPVLMGTAIAYGDRVFHLPSALAALLGAIFIQIGTNFANDYYDHLKGADAGERLGPTRVTEAGLVSPHAMRHAFILAFGLAMLAGLYLVWRAGWPIVAIGLASIFLGVIYTATPYALAYTGLADIFVLIFFGPVAVAGTYYVQSLALSPVAIIAGLGPGFFSVAILTINNLRDIEQDRRAGKKTLAVRFGRGFAMSEYVASVMLASLLPAILALWTREHHAAAAAVFVLLLAYSPLRAVLQGAEGQALNNVLAATGKLLFIYALIFSLGWII